MSRTLAVDSPDVRIGHNGGPPLDVGYHAWVWRRAHAQAWKNPGREIVLLRLRQAERLGLDYRTYTSILMDRGTRLESMLLMTNTEMLASEETVAAKLARLCDCKIILCVPARFNAFSTLLHSYAGIVMECPDNLEGLSLAGFLRECVRRHSLLPASIFMVGAGKAQRVAAERAGLGTFVDAREYFGTTKG